MMTTLKPVKSSSINAIGYDAATRTMEIQFVSGDIYRYAGVPGKAHRDLRNAESIGTHFGKFIRPTFAGLLVKRGGALPGVVDREAAPGRLGESRCAACEARITRGCLATLDDVKKHQSVCAARSADAAATV